MTDRAISRLEAKIAREARQQADAGLRALVATRAGRTFFWHILSLTGLFANPHNGNALNTAFACGEQNIGQKLLDELTRVAPDAYIEMIKESQEDDRINTARRDRAAGLADPGTDEPDD